ncbi:MAG TPA: hypothetical protein DEA08_28240 [Planctomycetes bacterium]|nr:hypothetical protein [Planctomycetota bacterium]
MRQLAIFAAIAKAYFEPEGALEVTPKVSVFLGALGLLLALAMGAKQPSLGALGLGAFSLVLLGLAWLSWREHPLGVWGSALLALGWVVFVLGWVPAYGMIFASLLVGGLYFKSVWELLRVERLHQLGRERAVEERELPDEPSSLPPAKPLLYEEERAN